jgi:hypothetical protein
VIRSRAVQLLPGVVSRCEGRWRLRRHLTLLGPVIGTDLLTNIDLAAEGSVQRGRDRAEHSRDLYDRLDQLHREHRVELEKILTEWERARLQTELEQAPSPWLRSLLECLP